MVSKREVRVKKYSRKPYRVGKRRVSPKDTRSHLRLIKSIMKLNADIKKSISTERDASQRYRAKLERERKAAIRKMENAKTLEEINDLRRQQAVISEENKLAEERMAGLAKIDEFRKKRIPFAPGTPASKYVGKLKTREEIEKIKSDIIRDRALALQQLALLRNQRSINEGNERATRREDMQAKATAVGGGDILSSIMGVSKRAAGIPSKALGHVAEAKTASEGREQAKQYKKELEREGLPGNVSPEEYASYKLQEVKEEKQHKRTAAEKEAEYRRSIAEKEAERKHRIRAENEKAIRELNQKKREEGHREALEQKKYEREMARLAKIEKENTKRAVEVAKIRADAEREIAKLKSESTAAYSEAMTETARAKADKELRRAQERIEKAKKESAQLELEQKRLDAANKRAMAQLMHEGRLAEDKNTKGDKK